MIGIVVVSHSPGLAHAARELAVQMVPGDQPVVACAAGLADGTLGTDAERIVAAVTEADSPDGVLVLMDLGSAVLSAEVALELLDPDVARRVTLSPAPLVEGLVAAVVSAAVGSPLVEVAAEAAAGLRLKAEHLDAGAAAPVEAPAQTQQWQRLSVVVPNRLGLHARPSAAFVRLLADSPARTRVRNVSRDLGPANGTSLVGIAGLNAAQGDELELRATGDDAAVRALFAEVKRFVEGNFGDDDAAPAAPVAGHDGFSGPLVRLNLEPVGRPTPQGPQAESARFEAALDRVRRELTAVMVETRRRVSDDAAEMVAAQLVFLDDAGLLRAVRERIAAGRSVLDAWSDELDGLRGRFTEMTDAYLRAREQDVWSLQQRMGRALAGEPEPDVGALAGVVVTRILDAPTAARLDSERVVGVVTAEGGTLGHGAMIAAARGIPFAADVADRFARLADGEVLTVEG